MFVLLQLVWRIFLFVCFFRFCFRVSRWCLGDQTIAHRGNVPSVASETVLEVNCDRSGTYVVIESHCSTCSKRSDPKKNAGSSSSGVPFFCTSMVGALQDQHETKWSEDW